MPSADQKSKSAAIAEETTTYDYTINRHYYTPDGRFEQSLDVYMPVKNSNNLASSKDEDAKQQEQPPKVPVVLVMGSGWLGHKPYFYVMTNWWNSSAPKQICGRLGHPCVSIRHSGGYLFGRKAAPSSSSSSLTLSSVVAALTVAIIAALVLYLSPSSSTPPPALAVIVVPLLLVIGCREGMGAAGIENMVEDVYTALAYIDAHASEWGLRGCPSNEKTIPIVFGGYSSGAHVAATLLTASSLSPLLSLNETGNASKPPQEQQQLVSQRLEHIRIRSVLYLSGVLDVSPDSFLMSLLSRVVLGIPPSKVPSPLRALLSSSTGGKRTGDENDTNGGVVQRVSLPPHIVIGCAREVFGWSILDSAFCARKYFDALRSHRSTPSREPADDEDDTMILLEGWGVNHWSILSSMALRNALRTTLTSCGKRA
jgi:hypothetical protein